MNAAPLPREWFVDENLIGIPIPPPTDEQIAAETEAWVQTLPAGVKGSMSNAHRTDPRGYAAAYRMIDGMFPKKERA